MRCCGHVPGPGHTGIPLDKLEERGLRFSAQAGSLHDPAADKWEKMDGIIVYIKFTVLFW